MRTCIFAVYLCRFRKTITQKKTGMQNRCSHDCILVLVCKPLWFSLPAYNLEFRPLSFAQASPKPPLCKTLLTRKPPLCINLLTRKPSLCNNLLTNNLLTRKPPLCNNLLTRKPPLCNNLLTRKPPLCKNLLTRKPPYDYDGVLCRSRGDSKLPTTRLKRN